MADPRSVLVIIMTPMGPVFQSMTEEEFNSFLSAHNIPLDQLGRKTPVPKVFEDAFKKEE